MNATFKHNFMFRLVRIKALFYKFTFSILKAILTMLSNHIEIIRLAVVGVGETQSLVQIADAPTLVGVCHDSMR